MDSTFLAGVAGAIAAALVTGLLTYLVTAWKVRRDLQVEYDKGLRADRLKAYAQLWAKTRPFSRYAPEAMDPSKRTGLLNEFSNWYYCEGGMYLSTDARDSYFYLMDAIVQASAPDAPDAGTSDELLRDTASDLRTQITADVGTRRPPLLGKG